MKKIINIVFITLFLFSCSKNDSITNFKDIYIYTSIESREKIKDIIENELFDFEYHTPSPQKKYTPIWREISQFIDNPIYSSLMLISLDEDRDSLSSILTDRLTENSINNITLVNNYYSENQLLFILKHNNLDDLSMDIAINKDWILSKLKENDFNNIKKYNFKSGLNDSLRDKCKEMFNFDIQIQKDYQVIKQDVENNYLWIGRGYPYRWIFIYEDIQRHYSSNESTYRRLNHQFNKVLNVNAFSYEANFDIIKTPNDDIRKVSGVYGTKIESDNPTGGPFVSYIFDYPESNRVVIASGFVNFPGKNKVFHIKELEYILETIK